MAITAEMNDTVNIIATPILAGLALFLLPGSLRSLKGIVAAIVCGLTFCYACSLWSLENKLISISELLPETGITHSGTMPGSGLHNFITLNMDDLSRIIILFIAFFSVVVVIYSLTYSRKIAHPSGFYEYFLITIGASCGAVLSDNLLLFVFFWGVLGITLYKLIGGHNENSSAAAEKTLIFIGGSDSVMLLGIALVWMKSGTLNMSQISLETGDTLSIIAFLALLTGSLTKAGAFPFHTWIPDYAQHAPCSSSAFLPASLDKLLGIYFLARIVDGLFLLNEWLVLFLLTTGVVTIITAVMMALVQHDYKRLLGYHAVSQVGYMIVGFGLGSMTGIAAGLFHMANHALYKSGLMMTAGCVEYSTGKSDIGEMGGLSRKMPVTFAASLVFALAISGIPPLNGFASKWLIYQGIVEFGSTGSIAAQFWIIWLGLAVLGSALTLASFIKLIGGVFLSREAKGFDNVKEVPFAMWLPLVILAALCVCFGIISNHTVVPVLFMPVSGRFELTGNWDAGPVSILVLISIVLGTIIYLAGNRKNLRREESFIGGEKMQEESGYQTVEFYKTFGEFRFLSWCYAKAGEKWFDLYELVKKSVLWFSGLFGKAHSGQLHDYALWVYAWLIVMLLILI